ncbi:mucin-5AC-like isoform X2 [Ruditapes philippinarum]|uniref:mucin-5AC-like isoform X2 n=1 Tax=Ruditapes philippinarum TaxID=129788 RepID=UPI00295BBD02|nr:mucin-5AC-like isoform X2 [Ruditapes philippinarum]
MGCKLCTCTKPNEEDRLENDRPKKRTTISNRFKWQLFGRKKDATVDAHPTSGVAVVEVNVTSETQVEDITTPIDVQINKAASQEILLDESKAKPQVVLPQDAKIVPVTTSKKTINASAPTSEKTEIVPATTSHVGTEVKTEVMSVTNLSKKTNVVSAMTTSVSATSIRPSPTDCNKELLCVDEIDNTRQSSIPINLEENTSEHGYSSLREAISIISREKPLTQTTVFKETGKLPVKSSSKDSRTDSSSFAAENDKMLPVIKSTDENKLSQISLKTDESKSTTVCLLNKKATLVSSATISCNENTLPDISSPHKSLTCTEKTEGSSTKQTPVSVEHKHKEMIQTIELAANDNLTPALNIIGSKVKPTAKTTIAPDTKVFHAPNQIKEIGSTPAIFITDKTQELPISSPEERQTGDIDIKEKNRIYPISSTDGKTKQMNDTTKITCLPVPGTCTTREPKLTANTAIAEKTKTLPVSTSFIETEAELKTNTSDPNRPLSVTKDRQLSNVNNDQVLSQNKSSSDATSSVSKSEKCTKERPDDTYKDSSQKKKQISDTENKCKSIHSNPSKTKNEVREPFRKLAITLKCAESLEDDSNQLKTNSECSSTAAKPLPQSSSRSQSLPTVSALKKMKVSDFAVPKRHPASPMTSLHLKPDAKHLFAIPAIAKADIKDESQIKWTQKESSSPKAQMPWMSRRQMFDVTFPPLGKSLLERFGTINRMQAYRYVPQTKSIEVLKLEHNRFPGLKLKASDIVKYPRVLNLAPSQTSHTGRRSHS